MVGSKTIPGQGSRRDRPTVVLSLNRNERLLHAILDLARKQEWFLVDLRFYRGGLPPGDPPQGAIVEQAYGSALVQELESQGTSIVRVGGRPHRDDAKLPAVVEDLPAAGRIAVEHFVERHFKHVAYVGHIPWSNSKALYEGFASRAAELGCTCHLLRFKSGSASANETHAQRHRRRQREFARWVKTVPRPLGLLGYHDEMAGRLCAMCAESGIEVPQQVAVLGHGNVPVLCECSPLTLSSVDPDFARQGETAVRLLAKLMACKPVPGRAVMIPPKGIALRESTDVLAAADPHVVQALRYMWDNLNRDISVNDIAFEVGVSRRKLERAFRQSLGRGVNEERLRRRLVRFAELLRTTNATIADLAPAVGFKSKDYLHRAFKQAYGTTPRKYRLRERAGDGEK